MVQRRYEGAQRLRWQEEPQGDGSAGLASAQDLASLRRLLAIALPHVMKTASSRGGVANEMSISSVTSAYRVFAPGIPRCVCAQP